MRMIFLQLFTYLDISSLRALRALQALRACFGGSRKACLASSKEELPSLYLRKKKIEERGEEGTL